MNGRCSKLLSLTLAALVSLVWAAGAQVKEPSGPTCKDNGECDRAQFCQKRSGKCQGPGHCVVRPQICPFIYDPVCGCDNVTYSNSCFAASVGVNVSYAGVCKSNCAKNSDCGSDQYCSKTTGNCGGRGTCAVRPQACIQIYDPVCGCDGKTYGNACTAASAGVNVSHLGECAAAKK